MASKQNKKRKREAVKKALASIGADVDYVAAFMDALSRQGYTVMEPPAPRSFQPTMPRWLM